MPRSLRRSASRQMMYNFICKKQGMSYIEDLKQIYGFVTDTYTNTFVQSLTMRQSLNSFGIRKTTTTVLDIINQISKIAITDIPPDTPNDVIPNRSTFTITLKDSTFTENIEKFDEGETTTIFSGDKSGNIYKRIHFDMTIEYDDLLYELEKFAREMCVGVFIQTVLNNDAKYGKNHIPKILGVYRDSKNGSGSDKQKGLSFFIVMENAGVRLDSLPSSKILYGTMVDIGNILHHFWKRYNFKHFDLHGGNVLLLGNVVKITDFDSASIRIRDTNFAVFQNNYATDDLFTLVTSLRDNSVLFREDPLSKIARLIKLFLLYDPKGKRISVYNVMKQYIAKESDEDKINLLELTEGVKYRQFPRYLWESDENRRLLLDEDKGILKNLQPDRFAQIWSALLSAPLLKGGFRREKHNRMTRKHKNKPRQSRKNRKNSRI